MSSPNLFQSTLPLRGATPPIRHQSRKKIHFNPHSPCGERRPAWRPYCRTLRDFNPHSPCGERHTRTGFRRPCRYFNPHSPCGERQLVVSNISSQQKFQSTLPLRGATLWRECRQPSSWNFNPHSPCGERRGRRSSCLPSSYFNPHSPCGERRRPAPTGRLPSDFNPHSPCGERHAIVFPSVSG